MSQYTTTIESYSRRNIIGDYDFGLRADMTARKIFDFAYPWYMDNNVGKKEWENMFVLHFWEREVGYETFNLFKYKLLEMLTIKMPYYKVIADAQGLIGNIFVNIDESDISDTDSTIDNNESAISGLTENEKENLNAEKNMSSQNQSDTTDNNKSTNDLAANNTVNNTESTSTESDKTAETKENGTVDATGSDTSTYESNETVDIVKKETYDGNDTDSGDSSKNIVLSGKDKTTINGTVDNTSDTTNTQDTNVQGLTSNNPQVTLGTKDYASHLQRDETVISGSQNESSHDVTNNVTDKTEDSTTDESGDYSSTKTKNYTNDTTDNNTKAVNDTKDEKSVKNESTSKTGKSSENENVTGKKTGNETEEKTETVNFDETNTSNTVSDTKENVNENYEKERGREEKSNRNVSRETNEKTNTSSNRYGWRGSKSLELQNFLETIKNINELLLDDCEELFMGVMRNPCLDDINIQIGGDTTCGIPLLWHCPYR